ncbi:MAG: hypothetical protein M3P51_15885, partial [Chloroflexota bacterium]|nr:hypothetical protein [Chloroflexota bacterium]
MRKPALDEDEGEVEQYDAVVPVHPIVREEHQRYIQRYVEPRRRLLGPDSPMFPGERLDRE